MSDFRQDMEPVNHPDYFSFHKQRLLPVFKPLLLFGAAINILFGISFLYTHPATGLIALTSMAIAALLILLIYGYVSQVQKETNFTLVVGSLGCVSLFFTVYFFVITEDRIAFISFALFYFLFAMFVIAPIMILRQLVIFMMLIDVVIFASLFVISAAPLDFTVTYIIYLSGLLIFVCVSVYKVQQNSLLSYELSLSLYRQSMRDELTDVYNRRAWYLATKKKLQKTCPRTIPVTVMLLDIDLFKGVNSSYGQIAGDRVLMRFVELIQSQLRPKDILGRLSGDQFVVFMPSMPLSVAEMIAEQIRSQVQLSSVTHMGHPIGITCTVGIACFNQKIDEISQIVQAADAELIEAKRKGRNCICAVEY